MDNGIKALITTLKGTRTYEQLSEDCGGTPTAGRIQQLATREQNTFPSPDTVRGLARGLRTSETSIVAACSYSLGLTSGHTVLARIASLLPPGTENLTDGQINAVLMVVQQFVQANIAHSILHDGEPHEH